LWADILFSHLFSAWGESTGYLLLENPMVGFSVKHHIALADLKVHVPCAADWYKLEDLCPLAENLADLLK
jgi:hypothetical protein